MHVLLIYTSETVSDQYAGQLQTYNPNPLKTATSLSKTWLLYRGSLLFFFIYWFKIKYCCLQLGNNLLKLIMTQGKRGLVMHAECVHSIVYNSACFFLPSSTESNNHNIKCTPSFHAYSCCFSLFLSVCAILPPCVTHTCTHTPLHSSSCTLWSGNQAASNCNNWKNVPSGLFEHLLALNFSHGYRLDVLCHTIWCGHVCVYVGACMCIVSLLLRSR